MQRFGGLLDLNPHLHMLVADGVFDAAKMGSAPSLWHRGRRDDLRAVIAR
ncbi:MAG: transposase [Deltaproteobacteria bacterium]|nr:transposase [Deltaproteobacteria bacterium]